MKIRESSITNDLNAKPATHLDIFLENQIDQNFIKRSNIEGCITIYFYMCV